MTRREEEEELAFNNNTADLMVTPSTLEVDYDRNLTPLYQAITDQDWDKAVSIAEQDPIQAATWVVRHYREENNLSSDDNDTNEGDNTDNEASNEIMWRFLPLHSACARQPPSHVISALLEAYPDAAKCVDDQGMYALHYACGNQAPATAIRQLLVHFCPAALEVDPRGMLPLHYLACWGPSNLSVVDMLLVATQRLTAQRDHDGNTPHDLALLGDYPEAPTVAEALRKWKPSGGRKVAKPARANPTRRPPRARRGTAAAATAIINPTTISLISLL